MRLKRNLSLRTLVRPEANYDVQGFDMASRIKGSLSWT